MRTCDVQDCDRKHLARGLCKAHYQRGATTGRLHTIVTRWTPDLLDEAEHLLGSGESVEQVATRLGASLDALTRAAHRYDRPELAKAGEKARGIARTYREAARRESSALLAETVDAQQLRAEQYDLPALREEHRQMRHEMAVAS